MNTSLGQCPLDAGEAPGKIHIEWSTDRLQWPYLEEAVPWPHVALAENLSCHLSWWPASTRYKGRNTGVQELPVERTLELG